MNTALWIAVGALVAVAIGIALTVVMRRRSDTVSRAEVERALRRHPAGSATVERGDGPRVATDAPLRERAAREGREYRPGMYDPVTDPSSAVFGATGWNSGAGTPSVDTPDRHGHATHHHGGSTPHHDPHGGGGGHSYGGHDSGGSSYGGDSGGGYSGGDSGGGSW